ncbi:flagellar FlbD family protein [Paraconexibacter sp.]|uniref:flagellar FlbD family protein n=1 Tax=Paraconexibacter sp. TaxID=2949640 RepID=UPI0035682C2E
MIRLHRLGRDVEPYLVNPDLIMHVEAMPDTHVTLTTGTRYVVQETPDEIIAAVRAWRVRILAEALAISGRAPLAGV